MDPSLGHFITCLYDKQVCGCINPWIKHSYSPTRHTSKTTNKVTYQMQQCCFTSSYVLIHKGYDGSELHFQNLQTKAYNFHIGAIFLPCL